MKGGEEREPVQITGICDPGPDTVAYVFVFSVIASSVDCTD